MSQDKVAYWVNVFIEQYDKESPNYNQYDIWPFLRFNEDDKLQVLKLLPEVTVTAIFERGRELGVY